MKRAEGQKREKKFSRKWSQKMNDNIKELINY